MRRLAGTGLLAAAIASVMRRLTATGLLAAAIASVMRRLAATGLLATAIAGAGLVPAAAAQPTPQLQGTFQMTGKVTVAKNVRGERVGEAVARTWTFTPHCATAPCATVQLVRQRATGTDTLTLHQTGPDTYAGTGSFSAPLRCSGRIYPGGQVVPFKVRVRITAVTGTVASAISATYVNRSRTNLTPCIGVLGHDAARYTGQLVTG